MFKRIVSILMVMCLILGSSVGCGTKTEPSSQDKTEGTEGVVKTEEPAKGEEESKYGGKVVVAYQSEPDTMNVYSTHLLADVQTCIIEGLIIPDENMNYVPVLAKEVPTLENELIKLTDDGKMTITYNLKEGVKWHDGEPFTSADVKYTWEALSDEKFLAEGKEGVYDIEKIETPDDYTVVCYYKYPVADFATTLFTFGIMPKHICEGTDLNEQKGYNRELIGTGPFKFKEWKPGEYIELVRNDNYHVEGMPYLDGIVFKFISDQNTQMSQLKTGEVDFVMGMPYDRYEELKNLKGINVVTNMQNAWTHLDFNLNNPMLADKTVRQAISYSIDKEAIVDKLFYGIPQAWESAWQPMDKYYNPNLKKHEYSLEKANKILDDAGWTVGSDGIREKDGQKLVFDFGVRSGYKDDEKVQQVIIESAKQIGINITASNAAAATMTAKWFSGDYDIKMHRWITGSASRTRFYGKNNMPPDGNNTIFWVDDEVTEIMEASDSEMDVNKRKEALFKVQEIMQEEVPTIPIYNNVSIIALNEKIGGFIPNPTNMTNFWNTKEWFMSN